MIKVTNEIREAARQLARHNKGHDEAVLKAIVDGKRKLIDADWWRKVHGDVNRAKLKKIAALADPERNSSEHERKVARDKLAAAKARRPPGMRPEPPPLPKDPSEWERRDRRVRKTKTPRSPQQPKLSDSVATIKVTAEIRKAARQSDSGLKVLNARRAAQRAANRAGLKCQSCGKPLAA